MVVEFFIDCADKNLDIRMFFLHKSEPLRGSDQAHEFYVLHAHIFQLLNARSGRAAGREHRVNDQAVALGDIGGHFAVIADGLQGIGVAVHAEVPDLCGGDEFQHTVDHAKPGAEDGDDCNFLAGDHADFRVSHWRFDLN